jgi:hypothetical protein
MSRFRYSASSLFACVFAIVLLLSSRPNEGDQSSPLRLSFCGLSLCTFFFMLLCGLFGHSALSSIVLSSGFYGWGLISLLLTDYLKPSFGFRFALAFLGIGYFAWALYDHRATRAILSDG